MEVRSGRHPHSDRALRPFSLQASLSMDGAQPEILSDIEPIIKFHYRVGNERDLPKSDPEYYMMRW
jgi:hypothetical protein